MTIQDDLDAIDANGSYTTDQKRILKYRRRSAALWDQLKNFIGAPLTFNALGSSWVMTLDSALAASFGHSSPVFVHPSGDLVIYCTLERDSVVVFPLGDKTNPLIVRNTIFRDSGGNENPLQAAKDILLDLVT